MTNDWWKDLYSEAWKEMCNARVEKLVEEFRYLTSNMDTHDGAIDDHYVSKLKDDL